MIYKNHLIMKRSAKEQDLKTLVELVSVLNSIIPALVLNWNQIQNISKLIVVIDGAFLGTLFVPRSTGGEQVAYKVGTNPDANFRTKNFKT